MIIPQLKRQEVKWRAEAHGKRSSGMKFPSLGSVTTSTEIKNAQKEATKLASTAKSLAPTK
jgi:ribosomal protein L5